MSFPTNCNPRFVNVTQSSGCTLTRASIQGMTPQMFEDQGMKEVGMDKLITNAQEAKVAGYRENTLEMLLMGRLTPIKGAVGRQKIGGSESVILPYIYRRQKRNINSNYFTVVAGAAVGGAAHSGTWNLTVKNHGGSFGSGLKNLQNYFLPGKNLLVETLNGTVSTSVQYTVLSSSNANAGGVERASVIVVPNMTAAGFAALTTGEKLVFQPTTGNVLNMANSISDYESWCHNEVAENTNKLLTYWLQRSRYTHEYSDEYLKALNAALTSGYFKDFLQLPLAEQKRIKYAKNQRDWINSVFYGQRINENQGVETYTSLPTVEDANVPGCTLEYKANALGFKTQLQDCGRYLDHQGNALNLDTLCGVGYDMKRAREADGSSADTIDFLTDRDTAGKILQRMSSLYKDKYGIESVRNYTQTGALKFDDQVAMPYNVYQLPPDLGGYNLAIFHHAYFDDKLAAFATAQKNRGRTLWGIDWTDVQIGIAETSSAQRQTNINDALYNCIIKPNIHHYELASTLWTSIIEDPSRHYIVDGFSGAAPTLTTTP